MTVYIISGRKLRSKIMNKTGLVLEGGAMRGLFTAGVMDTLMENDIRFDGLIGVSAGAAFGCNYKSRQIGRVLRYNKRFCRDKRYCSLSSLLKTGNLFGADFCYRQLPDELDSFDRETYNNDPMAFYLVCTDVHTGQAHYQSCPVVDEECFEWMRASASMPLVSRIVKIREREYLDGAIADSIPLRFFEEKGYNKNVVVLTQPAGFCKKTSKAMRLLRIVLHKYPALIQALETRHERYNETLRYLEEQSRKGNIFLLRPESPLPVGRICHDPEKLQQTYDIGREYSAKLLPQIKKFLEQTEK